MGEGEVANRPDVIVNGEEVQYRASSLGSCTRALAAARQELEPWRGSLPAKIAEVFERGHKAEEYGKAWFKERGWAVTDEQREVVVGVTGRISVVGHIDYIVSRHGGDVRPILVDSKSQSEDEFAKPSIRDSTFWHKYKWQFSVYALGTGLAIAVQRIGPDGTVKLEVVGELYGEADVRARVLQVEAMARGDLKGVVCDKDDFPCPYWKLLHPATQWEEREDETLADLALHYKRLAVEIDPLVKRRAELREKLIEHMGEGKVEETISGIQVSVVKSTVKEKIVPEHYQTRVNVVLPKENVNAARPDDS